MADETPKKTPDDSPEPAQQKPPENTHLQTPVPDSDKEFNRRRFIQPRDDEREKEENDKREITPPSPDDGQKPSLASPTALACWAVLGFFFGVIGIIVAWVVVRKEEPPVKNKAIMYAVMGCAIEIFFGMMILLFTGTSTFPAGSGGSSSAPSAW